MLLMPAIRRGAIDVVQSQCKHLFSYAMTSPISSRSLAAGRYRPRRLIVLTGGLLLAMAAVTASMLYASYNDTLHDRMTSLRNVSIAVSAETMSVAKAVDGTLTRAAAIHRYLGSDWVGRVLLDDSSSGVLEYIRRLAIVDASGRVVASVSPRDENAAALPPLSVFPKPQNRAKLLRVTISNIDPKTGHGLINFTKPLVDQRGDIVGTLIAQIDTDRFQRLFSLVELGTGGSVTLFDRDGMMLVRGPPYAAGIGRSFSDTPLFREHLPHAERGVLAARSPLDGTARLYAYDAVPGYSLVVIAGMDRRYALASWYGRLWTAIVFYVVLASMLVFVTWRVGRDARRQARLIEQLSASEARLGKRFDYLSSIIDAVGAPIWVIDTRLCIVMSNDAFARLVGCPGRELVGMEEQAVFSTQDMDRRGRYLALLAEGTRVETIGPMCDGVGETRTVIQLTTKLVAETGETQLVNVLTDITERERAEARLAYLAEFDVLTGLPNQSQFWRLLEARLAGAAVNCRGQAVLALFFERLHEIVDLLGNDAGDRALKQVGDLLRGFAGETVVVARLRGAEFALLVDAGAGRTAVERFALELHDRCCAPLLLDEREFFLGPVLGVALFPQDASGADELYRCAQSARGGRGVELGDAIHFYSARLHADLDQRLTVEAQLRRALERDELRLVFQPKVTVEGGAVVGYEALMRWSSPALGEVPPVRFIPIAERTGLIIPIGAWAMEQSCRLIGEWAREYGRTVKIAVNLSPRQFYQRTLLATIRRCLDEHGVPPGSLEIEITETALMSREEEVDHLMHDIRALGVTLSIDDFGTGYSSLAYLKRFPVARLKVDRAFVRDLGKDEDSAAITRSIINLARGLKLKVVAEGVETEVQLKVLHDLGCDEYQGFLFSQPLERDQMRELFLHKVDSLDGSGSK